MEKIGKYQIAGKIGSGGFGEVFKGYDPFIKRHVAVKTCNSSDDETRSRFFQEAEIAGNLHHRNITTVYDFGISEGLPYLIQEYLSGEDLHAKIKRRDFLPYPEKLYYLLQIARGLAHAHSEGVIHRDIKPANIRILEDGTAKIMDFGIAKLAQQESGLTQTGMALGTAAYLAPEQVRGDPVDHRTDIFSFGVLAYELLTYERPFSGEQISTVIYQVLHHEPKPIDEVWPAAPPDLVALTHRCLHKNADDRYANGNALVMDLEALQKRGRADPEAPGQGDPGAVATPRPAPAGTGLDQVSYNLAPSEQTRTMVGEAIAVQAAPARLSPAVSLTILLLLATGAAAAGWWYGMREEAQAVATRPADGADPGPASPSDGGSSPTAQPAEDGPPTNGGAPNDEPPDTAPQETAPPPPQTAPPPPEPAPGRLTLESADWTDAMTVRIAGRTYTLHGLRVIELPPGSYRAVFDLDTPTYSPRSRETTVEIAAGRQHRLAVAIPAPGALSVRPLPRRAQGQVSIDGEPQGPTPLSELRLEPGRYTVEILPREGEDEGLTRAIDVASGQEVVLSFDLSAGQVRSRTKPLNP